MWRKTSFQDRTSWWDIKMSLSSLVHKGTYLTLRKRKYFARLLSTLPGAMASSLPLKAAIESSMTIIFFIKWPNTTLPNPLRQLQFIFHFTKYPHLKFIYSALIFIRNHFLVQIIYLFKNQTVSNSLMFNFFNTSLSLSEKSFYYSKENLFSE